MVENLILTKKKLLTELEVVETQLNNLKTSKTKSIPKAPLSVTNSPSTRIKGDYALQRKESFGSKSAVIAQNDYIAKLLSENAFSHHTVVTIWNDYEV